MQEEKDNLKCLAAWNEWKGICWVGGCTNEYKSILTSSIDHSFRVKLKELLPKNCRELLNNGDWTDEKLVREFDYSILEYEQIDCVDHRSSDGTRLRKKKNWKNFVWEKVAKSSDPPLKVIRGQLIGPHGIINDIILDFIQKNFSLRLKYVKDPVSEKIHRVFVEDAPLDAPVGKNDDGKSASIGDFLSSPEESRLDLAEGGEALRQFTTDSERVILLALLRGIPLSDEDLMAELGLQKSRISEIGQGVKEKIKKHEEFWRDSRPFWGIIEDALRNALVGKGLGRVLQRSKEE